MSQIKRRVPIHNILLQALVLFAFLGPVICGCDERPKSSIAAIVEADFGGTWEGHTIPAEPDKVPVPVDLRKSDGDYIFHYGPPLSFELTAEKSTLQGNKLTLIIKETSGGKGDVLWKGTIMLTMADDKNHMDAVIRDKDSGAKWNDKAKLEKTK